MAGTVTMVTHGKAKARVKGGPIPFMTTPLQEPTEGSGGTTWISPLVCSEGSVLNNLQRSLWVTSFLMVLFSTSFVTSSHVMSPLLKFPPPPYCLRAWRPGNEMTHKPSPFPIFPASPASPWLWRLREGVTRATEWGGTYFSSLPIHGAEKMAQH